MPRGAAFGGGRLAAMNDFYKLLVVLVGAVCATFVVYDLVAFLPRRTDIERLIACAHPLERSPPPALRALILADDDHLGFRSARLLLGALQPGQRGSLEWQLDWSVWSLLVRIHLDEDERVAIVASRAFLGKHAYGFQAGALSEYSRGLDALSERELARLVILQRWPTRMRTPELSGKVDRLADALVQRAHRLNRS